MPRTEAQKLWREQNGRVTLDLPRSTLEGWKAYATSKGMPLATLIRQHMADAMQRDGWTQEEGKEKS